MISAWMCCGVRHLSNLPPLFAAHPLKMAILRGIQADKSCMPLVCKALRPDICIPGIFGVSVASPLEVNEAKARLYPHFLPYDGLRTASDKVLGKLFYGNGWVSFETNIVQSNIIHNKQV